MVQNSNKEVKEEGAVKEEVEETKEETKDEEEEVDPLDAFMAEVQEEVRKVNKLDSKTPKSTNNGTGPGNQQSGGVVIVTGS